VLTTGATMRSAALALRAAGARTVVGAAACRAPAGWARASQRATAGSGLP
jgi:adenine/guanine phosphoribosyltransferase-like PRPP-binding protein